MGEGFHSYQYLLLGKIKNKTLSISFAGVFLAFLLKKLLPSHLNGRDSGEKSSEFMQRQKPNKQNQTHTYLHISSSFKVDSVLPRQAEWNGLWALLHSDKIFQRILVSFLEGTFLSNRRWMMSWGDVCAWLICLFFFLLLSLSAWLPFKVELLSITKWRGFTP